MFWFQFQIKKKNTNIFLNYTQYDYKNIIIFIYIIYLSQNLLSLDLLKTLIVLL